MSRFLSFGNATKRRLQQNRKLLDHQLRQIRSLENQVGELTDSQLRESFEELQLSSRISDTSALEAATIFQSAALGTEAVRRIMGFRLHDVQLQGALATAAGAIIQMNTGEGKTMVCGLAALLRSVHDRSVHVATTNAYLAERDHETVQPIFELLGITSAFIGPETKPQEIRKAYRCNITYAPGYMFGFDYLRDQLLIRDYESVTLGRDVLARINGSNFADKLSQTSFDSIIVDEADSVLIDESTTPLLLSGPGETASENTLLAYQKALETSLSLAQETHYTVQEIDKQIDLTDEGLEQIHQALDELGRLELCQPWSKYITNALYAENFLVRDEDYVVDEEQIKLVDQNTGRIFNDRSLRAGLHQALEAKEKLTINPPNSTMARVTRQRFFQLYDMVCGMTGTAVGSEAELKHFYDVDIIPLPPNKKCKRIHLSDRFFDCWESKLAAIVDDVIDRRDKQQPILIGSRTIRESILIEQALAEKGIECRVLNGIQDESEADLVGDAGQAGEITIATNMAGRGTDIKLSDEARTAGGLHVIGSQRFVSRRVDGQLAGRAARQGDPGSCQFFIAADDQLIKDHAPALAKRMISNASVSGECKRDFSHEIKTLQNEIEYASFKRRCKLVQQESWLDSVRETMVGR